MIEWRLALMEAEFGALGAGRKAKAKASEAKADGAVKAAGAKVEASPRGGTSLSSTRPVEAEVLPPGLGQLRPNDGSSSSCCSPACRPGPSTLRPGRASLEGSYGR